MKLPTYTNAVLTVIALALIWLGVSDAIRKPTIVSAQGPVRVILTQIDPTATTVPLSVKLVGGMRYSALAVDATNPLAVKAVE